MPSLIYRATNFPASYGAGLAGAHRLTFSWPELVWAAISVGRAELLHLLRYGPYSAFEIVYRAAILYANLRETGSTDLARSAAYEGLDPSEKGAISYFMGLAVAKLFADRMLDVPWLMHLDVYRQQLQPVHGAGRPDLVGQNSAGEWVAIESKGRTHGYNGEALTRAKEQVESLASIGGQPVSLRVALLAHFGDGVLQCAVDDPEGPREDRRRVDLPLSEEKLFEGYYRPFREWLRDAPNTRIETVRDQTFRLADTPEVGVTVGLREDFVVGEAPPTRGAVVKARVTKERMLSDTEYLGADGVLVRVGALWSEENMRQEPQGRKRS